MTVRRNIIASWLAHAVTLVVGLFLVRYVKDTLGDDGYGAWIFISSVAGYAGLLYAGFGAAICRYTAKHHTNEEWDELNSVASSIFSVYAVNSLLCLLGGVAFAIVAPYVADWEGQSLSDIRIAVVLVGAGFMLNMLGSVFAGILIGVHRFDIKRSITVTSILLKVGLLIAVFQWDTGVVGMAVVLLILAVGENIAYYLFAKRCVPQLSIRIRHIRRDVFKEMLPFVSWNAVSMVSHYLIYLTDTVVIGMTLGTSSVTPYYIALRLAQMMQMPVEQVAEVIIPKVGELHVRKEFAKLSVLIERIFGLAILLMAGFFIGSWYFGGRVFTTWLGPGNESSHLILIILVASQVVAMPARVFKNSLLAIGEIRGPGLLDLSQAIVNLVLSLILVRGYGVIGVAWGTLIPIVTIELFLLVPYTTRKLNLSLSRLIVHSVLPQLPALAALFAYSRAIAAMDLPQTWNNLLGITAGGGAVLVGARYATHLGINLITQLRDRRFETANLSGDKEQTRSRAGAKPVANSDTSSRAAATSQESP